MNICKRLKLFSVCTAVLTVVLYGAIMFQSIGIIDFQYAQILLFFSQALLLLTIIFIVCTLLISKGIIRFENADKDWLTFVVNNRKGKIVNDNADMHKGPVADDNVYQSIRLFETGAYDAEYTVKKLKTEVLHDQWTLHTNKILEHLKFIEAKEIR